MIPKPEEGRRWTGERRGPFLGGIGVRRQERPVGADERYRRQDGHRSEMGQGSYPREAINPPSAAPARPPKLQAAWKEDMIGRPYPLSTTTACAFMETSSPPFAAPSSMRAGTSKYRFGARAGVTSERESKSAVVPTTRRLPRRETRAPTSGMATRAPTAAPSNATPSRPSPNRVSPLWRVS